MTITHLHNKSFKGTDKMNRLTRMFSMLVAAALLASGITAPSQVSAACADPGCVLPVSKPAPAPAPASAPAQPVVEEGGGFPILAALLGAAAIVGAILLLSDDDDDEPVSA